MHIGGTNFQFGKERTKYSYYFSRYTHLWGWASWRRAWKYYDVKLKQWPEGEKNEIGQMTGVLLISGKFYLKNRPVAKQIVGIPNGPLRVGVKMDYLLYHL